jgi:hypothetical protein
MRRSYPAASCTKSASARAASADSPKPSTCYRTTKSPSDEKGSLHVLAQSRSNAALQLIIDRFRTKHVMRLPEVRVTLEGLVGEIERAQERARTEPQLLVKDACPSLTKYELTRDVVLDFPPLRSTTKFYVRSVMEETLDDLARLVEQE